MPLELQNQTELPQLNLESSFIQKFVGQIKDPSLKVELEKKISKHIAEVVKYMEISSKYRNYLDQYLAAIDSRKGAWSPGDKIKMSHLKSEKNDLAYQLENNRNQMRILLEDQISPSKAEKLVTAVDLYQDNLAKYPIVIHEYKKLTAELSAIIERQGEWFKSQMKKPGMTRNKAINDQTYQDYNLKMEVKFQQKMEKLKELENLRNLLPNWEEIETKLGDKM